MTEEDTRLGFAQAALMGLLANPMASREIARDAESAKEVFGHHLARNCFDIADSMLEVMKRYDEEPREPIPPLSPKPRN